MTLYYFHIRDGDTYDEDTVGVELTDAESARKEAIMAAREMLSEQIVLGIPIGEQVFEICEEQVMIFTLAFRDPLHS